MPARNDSKGYRILRRKLSGDNNITICLQVWDSVKGSYGKSLSFNTKKLNITENAARDIAEERGRMESAANLLKSQQRQLRSAKGCAMTKDIIDSYVEEKTGEGKDIKNWTRWVHPQARLVNFCPDMNHPDAEEQLVKWWEAWNAIPLKNGKPKADRTKLASYRELRALINWAWINKRETGLTQELDIRFAKRPKARLEPQPFYTIGEIRALLNVDDPFRYVIALFAFTGMRLGEGLAVKFKHFNDGYTMLSLPGEITKSGDPRTIPLPPQFRKMLIEYLDYVKTAIRANYRRDPTPDDSIFLNPNRSHYEKEILKIQRLAGVPRMATCGVLKNRRWHALRRSYMGILLALGLNASQIRMWSGHSDASDMLHHYAIHMPWLYDQIKSEGWPRPDISDPMAPVFDLRLLHN